MMTSDEEEDLQKTTTTSTRPQKRARKASALAASSSEAMDTHNGNSGDDTSNTNSSTTTSTASKPRQSSKDKGGGGGAGGGEDPQRERKRILDRLSQRATRDRTRNKIAYLEDLVRKFETQSESDQIRDLLKQVEDLRVEKDRLARCLGQISGLVECAVNPKGGTTATHGGDESGGDSGHSPGNTQLEATAGPSPFPQKGQLGTPPFISSPSTIFAPMMDAQGVTAAPYQGNFPGKGGMPGIMPTDHTGVVLPSAVTESLRMDTYRASRLSSPPLAANLPQGQQTFSRQSSHGDISPNYDIGASFPTNASTTTGIGPEGKDMIVRDSWTYCNVTLSRGLAACRRLQQIQKRQNKGKMPHHTLDWSIPIRAILHGWDSVKAEVDPHRHPIWAVLKLVDLHVFSQNQPIERLAVIAIMGLTMQYYLYPTTENRDKLPTWLRTRPSQENVKNYPITVDFFVWPGIRDRFVYTHAEYSAVSTLFSMKFRENLKFVWPDGFEDLFYTSQPTPYSKPQYHLTPKFEETLRQLHCWSMDREFFTTFPELQDDIPRWNGPAGPLSGSMRLPPNVWVSWDYPGDFGNGGGNSGGNGRNVPGNLKLEELNEEDKEQEIQRRWEIQLQQMQRGQSQPMQQQRAGGSGGRIVPVEKDLLDGASYTTASAPNGWMPNPTQDIFNAMPIPGTVFGYPATDAIMTHVTQSGY